MNFSKTKLIAFAILAVFVVSLSSCSSSNRGRRSCNCPAFGSVATDKKQLHAFKKQVNQNVVTDAS